MQPQRVAPKAPEPTPVPTAQPAVPSRQELFDDPAAQPKDKSSSSSPVKVTPAPPGFDLPSLVATCRHFGSEPRYDEERIDQLNKGIAETCGPVEAYLAEHPSDAIRTPAWAASTLYFMSFTGKSATIDKTVACARALEHYQAQPADGASDPDKRDSFSSQCPDEAKTLKKVSGE